YSLWKATSKIKETVKVALAIRKIDGTWARSEQAEEFASYLHNTFAPHNANNSNSDNHVDTTTRNSDSNSNPLNEHHSVPTVTAREDHDKVKNMKSSKSPGIDLINCKTGVTGLKITDVRITS
ncbi:hypothetical protein WH47_10465, partial [Habropoda laboriosa]